MTINQKRGLFGGLICLNGIFILIVCVWANFQFQQFRETAHITSAVVVENQVFNEKLIRYNVGENEWIEIPLQDVTGPRTYNFNNGDHFDIAYQPDNPKRPMSLAKLQFASYLIPIGVFSMALFSLIGFILMRTRSPSERQTKITSCGT